METEEDKDFYPDMDMMNTHELCATIIPFNTNRKGFREFIGAFPHKSICGNLYFTVMYDYDINAIIAEPINTGRQKPYMIFSQKSQDIKVKSKRP